MKILKIGSAKFQVRDDSPDRRIVREAYKGNVYGFPEDMSGMTVVDIGAHIGTVAVLCSQRGAKVYSLEPDPENFEILKRNLDRNDAFSVSPIPMAIGGTEGFRELQHNPANTASNVLVGLPNKVAETNGSNQVWVTTIKELFKEIEVCDYLKIDCEGAEVEIVDDIIEMKDKIKNMVAELHTDEAVKLFEDRLSPYYTFEKIKGPFNHYEYKLSQKK